MSGNDFSIPKRIKRNGNVNTLVMSDGTQIEIWTHTGTVYGHRIVEVTIYGEQVDFKIFSRKRKS